MTALAVGSSVTVAVRDGGTVTIATNGGFGSAVVTTAEGVTSTVSFGPAPERRVLGPYKEGASVVLTNSSSGAFDYDVETMFDPSNVAITGGKIGGATLTRVIPAGNKSGSLGGITGASDPLSDGVSTSTTSRIFYKAPPGGVSDIQVIFPNWYLATAGETAAPNPITVKAALEYSGVSYPLTSGGATTFTIAPGAFAVCDPVGLVVPAGAPYFVRTYVSVTAGQKWPRGRQSGGNEGTNGASGADITASTGGSGFSFDYMYGPCAVLGVSTAVTQPSVGLVGDSIGAGTGDGSGDANGNYGPLERAMGISYGWISSTRSGTKLADFNTAHARRMAYFPRYVTSVICELGINDVMTDGADFATMQARLQAAWSEFSSRGIAVFQTTLTPYTTSTDSWATLANQTLFNSARDAVRTQVNDWIRTRPSPLSGYIELADAVESARNSGKWRVDLGQPTTDGLHPKGSTLAAVMVAAVNAVQMV